MHTHTKQKWRNATCRVSLQQYCRTSEVPKFLCFYRAPKSRQNPIKARTAACDEEPGDLMLKLFVFTAQDTGMYYSPVLLTYFVISPSISHWCKILSGNLILYVDSKTRTLFVNPFLTDVFGKTSLFLFCFYTQCIIFKGTWHDLILLRQ